MKHSLRKLALCTVAALLTACGGGSGDQNARVTFSSLVVFGDSLSDVGTHKVGTIAALDSVTGGAGRWTINSVAGGEIWNERVAALLGLPRPCAAETGLLPNLQGITGAPPTAHAGCTNYAQGSARVSSPFGPYAYALQLAINDTNLGLLAKPVQNQMAAHLTAVGGSYSGNELVTVMAGANDVFMELAAVSANSQTPETAVTNVATAGATLGGLIKTQVLAKGARRVLVLNVPDIVGTPFGRAQPAPVQGLIDTMVNAFNSALAAQLAGLPQVKFGDTYTASKDQTANPTAYGISNATTAACGANALGTTSLVCNASNTLTGIDVSHYLFADDVHPTPYGHQLLSQFVSKLLAQAGWL